MKKPLLISFSGGKTSAYMTYMLVTARPPHVRDFMDEYEPYIVYANTGQEHPKTLEFIHNCEKHYGWDVTWLEAKVNPEPRQGTRYNEVDFVTASLTGEPYEAMIAKYGIPNAAFPHCTRELKLAPINSWCKDRFGTSTITTAIGIRTDEARRVSATADKRKIIYPLIDLIPSDKQDVLDFWETQPFQLGLPEHLGNCTWCWKKSTKKLLKVMAEMPNAFDFPERMERDYPLGKNGKPLVFFRNHTSVQDLRKLFTQTGEPDDKFIEDSPCSESCDFLETIVNK